MASTFPIVHPNGITQEPYNSELEPIIDIHSGATFIKAENTVDCGEHGLQLNIERKGCGFRKFES
jgi:hypothetical protein